MGEEFPEAELVRRTLTIRTMDLPPNIEVTRKGLLRWFCLAFGLISEKESRSTILDVVDALFTLHFAKGLNPTTTEIHAHLQEKQADVSEKLLRYHLKRLIDVGLIERKKLHYYFVSSPYGDKKNIKEGFNYNITQNVSKTLNDIESVLEKIEGNYKAGQ